jgi:hypothetical protein
VRVEAAREQSAEKQIIFAVMVPEVVPCIQSSYGSKNSIRWDDMVMKMQRPELAFVDGLYAKFYSLSSELLRVGPKCSSSSATPDSFHPAEAVAGKLKAASIRLRSADCSRLTRRLRGNESLDPGVRIHHGRKP